MTTEERKIKLIEKGLFAAFDLLRELEENRANRQKAKKQPEKPQDAFSLSKLYMDKLNNKIKGG